MRSIQEIGLEILNNNPKSLYILCGPEYGLKQKYIDVLKKHYKGSVSEYSSVFDVINLFKTKRFVPLPESLYIVRYDEEFVSKLDKDTSKELSQSKILGTLVCLYDDEKSESKLSKYLGNYTTHIDSVLDKFQFNYLSKDYPNLGDRLIELAIKFSKTYGQADLMCSTLSNCSKKIDSFSEQDIANLFGAQQSSTDEMIKFAIANRDFSRCCELISIYPGQLDSIVYIVLSTMVELEKIKSRSSFDSKLQKQAKNWTMEDIYNMFMQAYDILNEFRSITSDYENRLVYLMSLLKYRTIPEPEVLK